MTKNVAVIGCGNIAIFHIPAMRDAGFNIFSIAGSLNSNNAVKFAKKYDIDKVYNNPLDLINNSSEWDALLILSPVETVVDYLKLAAPFGKPILTEKPVALKNNDLKTLINYKNIRVAYNRRFYSGAIYAKKFIKDNPNALIKVTIPEQRKDPDHNVGFPDRLPLMSYENSVHMFDLLQYIAGEVRWSYVSTIKGADKYIATVALGESVKATTIQLDSYFNAPDNFSINIIAGDKRLEMRPIEITSLYNGMEIHEPTQETPIRVYSPKIENKIIDMPEQGHKPGFLGQAQDFMNFCTDDEDMCIGANIVDAYSALKLAQSLVK
jgi:predicted dehydrogenase